MHEGALSSRLGMRGIPAVAEVVVVARDLALARLSGVRYHVQHVSTSTTIDLVRRAKEDGHAVTAEVTPHHLSFIDEKVLTLDPAFKMYPPLRTRIDLEALRGALSDGLIDAVATDHAPHAAFETEVPFEEAPRGVIGLETAAAAVNTALNLSQPVFFDRLSLGPARIARFECQGLAIKEGCPANVVIFDPRATWTPAAFLSKSHNSPFVGCELRGRVMATIFQGQLTHRTEMSAHRS